MSKKCKKMIFLMSFVLVLSLVGSVQAFFDTWTATGPEGNWNYIAMSADGTIQTACANDRLYVSTDAGGTWTAKGPGGNWASVAMSTDGTIQTAGAYADNIYVSLDSGNTWTAKKPLVGWPIVAMSADGTIQTVVLSDGEIYVSADSGNNWTAVTEGPSETWRSVAMSADGTIQTAVGYSGVDGGIYVSVDSGNTWTAKGENRLWEFVAMSADGTIQTAVDVGGRIYVSTDTGDTWTAKASDRGWKSVAMSADGTIQTAVTWGAPLYVSLDSGNTWTAKGLTQPLRTVAMSADGCIQAVAGKNIPIYSCSEDPVLLNLNPIPSNGSVIPLAYFDNKLQWTLPEPNNPGDDVLCDVHFGTDPNNGGWDNPKVVDMEAVESVDITVTANTTYYWAVAIYDPSVDPVLSETFEFTIILNVPPIVNAGDDVDSWLVDELPIPEGTERVVQLNGIVTDDGHMEPYTVLWTVLSEPDSVENPAVISDSSIVDPTITMTVPGLYNLELEADDGEFTVTDSMVIQLYDTSCTHAQNQAGFAWLAGDNNRDCKVNLPDFANLAATWLEENYSTE